MNVSHNIKNLAVLRHMNQIHNRVISSKIGEKECERAKTAMNSLFEKGELPRNTISCLVREALNKLVDETLEGKNEKREKELEEMKEKLRTMENEIRELETENNGLKDEKTSLERKQKNSEKLIVELLQTSGDSSIENANLKIEIANLRQKFQNLQNEQPIWKDREFKELFLWKMALAK